MLFFPWPPQHLTLNYYFRLSPISSFFVCKASLNHKPVVFFFFFFNLLVLTWPLPSSWSGKNFPQSSMFWPSHRNKRISFPTLNYFDNITCSTVLDGLWYRPDGFCCFCPTILFRSAPEPLSSLKHPSLGSEMHSYPIRLHGPQDPRSC